VNNLEERDDRVEDAWAESLREVLRDVIKTLPGQVTLRELVDATRSNSQLAPVLDHFTVQELIDLVKDRPRGEPSDLALHGNGGNGNAAKPAPKPAPTGEVMFDEEGNPLLDLDNGPAVIRRRADVPDGDVRLLSALSKQKSGRRENELLQTTGLASDQVRLILRNLRTKGFIHVEGSGIKRRIKITRHGTAYLRKYEPNAPIAY
jgi:predicted transcriptional regulator